MYLWNLKILSYFNMYVCMYIFNKVPMWIVLDSKLSLGQCKLNCKAITVELFDKFSAYNVT